MRRSLNVLDDLRIASPCSESWERMTGDERVRHCGKCQLDVFNLSEMTRDDAMALLEARAGVGQRMCVRLYRRADGTVITQDCPAALQRVRRRVARLGAALAGLLLAAVSFAGGARRGESAELEASTGSKVTRWVSGSWMATATPPPSTPPPYTMAQGGITAWRPTPVTTPAPKKLQPKKTKPAPTATP
jgi:hypothetical protein